MMLRLTDKMPITLKWPGKPWKVLLILCSRTKSKNRMGEAIASPILSP